MPRSPISRRVLPACVLSIAGLGASPSPAWSAEPEPAPAPAPAPKSELKSEPERTPASEPQPAQYSPLFHLDPGGMRLEAQLLMATRFEDAEAFPIDDRQTEIKNSALHNQLRIGARFDSKLVLVPFLSVAEYEHDLITGYAYGRPELGGFGLPNHQQTTHQLRKLWGRGSLGPYLHLGGGFMVSHWGLGLVANDGAHGWTPGSARFTEPFGGDRVLRGFLASGPLTDEKIFASLAIDKVVDDDVLFAGDDAYQLVAAFILGRNQPKWFGVYFVHRVQDSARGARTEVNVFDVAASATFGIFGGSLTLEGELVKIAGTTGLAGSGDFPTHDVEQTGAAARATFDAGSAGAVLDFVYASGDRDLDDGVQAGFRADPNYSVGLVLFQHVLAAHTGRSVFSASNLDIVGVPPDDVERFATRGSIANTIAFAPRAFIRPLASLEFYGGPLFAFSAAALLDPFQTRVAGGTPRNAFAAAPGDYLGTEIDLGVRLRTLVEGTELTFGLEYGVLFPGDAFDSPGAGRMHAVNAGRAMLSYRL